MLLNNEMGTKHQSSSNLSYLIIFWVSDILMTIALYDGEQRILE